MTPPQTNSAVIPQDLVTKVGSAVVRVSRIEQEYAMQAETETATDVRGALADRARAAAEQAINEQGITVEDYNAVLSAAEENQDLGRRLLEAARKEL